MQAWVTYDMTGDKGAPRGATPLERFFQKGPRPSSPQPPADLRLLMCLQTSVTACLCAQLLKTCLTLQPHGLQPTRLLCPRDSPGKNTGVG